MRKVLIVLTLLVLLSVAANIVLWRRLAFAQYTVHYYQSVVKQFGHRLGRAEAERDFWAGMPRWYEVGGIQASLPSDKTGRRLVRMVGDLSEDELAFVESYNKRMDDLLSKNDNEKANNITGANHGQR